MKNQRRPYLDIDLSEFDTMNCCRYPAVTWVCVENILAPTPIFTEAPRFLRPYSGESS